MTSLGELSGEPGYDWSTAYGLNDMGQVVGQTATYYDNNGDPWYPLRAFIWLPVPAYNLDQGMHDLGIFAGQDPLWQHSVARDINEYGHLTGTSGGEAFVWFAQSVPGFPLQELCELPEVEEGSGGEAWALDDGGHDGQPLRVVGFGTDGPCPEDEPHVQTLGFVWESSNPTQVTTIGPSAGWGDAKLYGINPDAASRRVLAGGLSHCGVGAPPVDFAAGGIDGAGSILLELAFPELFGVVEAQARDASDEGELVGWGEDDSHSNRDRALYWESVTSDPPVNLHTETGIDDGYETRAEAIARPGGLPYVVGWNATTRHALLWKRDGQGEWTVEDLNNLIGTHAQDDWILREAHDINNSTWIVGWGLYDPPYNPEEGDYRAFLLSTAKDCPADLDFDGDVDTGDLLILLGNWGYCPEGEICWSDIDMDGAVNTADLLRLLGAWGECGKGGGSVPQNVQDCIQKFGLDPVALEACIQAVTGELD